MSTTFGLFNTSIMGMAAQADALANISENIANVNTVGYKEATTHFLTVLNGFESGGEFGGGVATRSCYQIDAQGGLQRTSSSTDLAIKGNGFFVVSDASGATFLTRAGSFVPDAQGRLVNAAGYYLMGFDAKDSPAPSATDALTGMTIVRVRSDKLIANPSTKGVLSANLPAGASITPAANLPSTNSASAAYSAKTSLTTYDNLGARIVLDIYYTKTASNTWEMAVYNSADAAAAGGFPYSSGPLATQTMTFDPGNGDILSGSAATVPIPGGASMALDLRDTTQLGTEFVVIDTQVDGNAAGAICQIQLGSDGLLTYLLDNGQSMSAYKIWLADVDSPTNLSALSGNVYAANSDSGEVFLGSARSGAFGSIESSALENSTVDLATELSSMIVAQRAFTANSQVFQVASDVLQVLTNLK